MPLPTVGVGALAIQVMNADRREPFLLNTYRMQELALLIEALVKCHAKRCNFGR